MSDTCSVVGCSNARSTEEGVRFFRFPSRYEEQRDLWIKSMNRVNADGSIWQPSQTSVVCSDHFTSGRPNPCQTHTDYYPTIFPTSEKNHKSKSTDPIDNMKTEKKKKKEFCCRVVGCKSKQPTVKFYNFSRRNLKQRELWIKAVNQVQPGGSAWLPKNKTRLCGKHFVSGAPSSNRSHPDYVPTIFPGLHKKKNMDSKEWECYLIRARAYRISPAMAGARIPLYLITLISWICDVIPTWGAITLLTFAYLLTGGHYTLYLIWHTGARDARGAFRYLKLLSIVYFYQKRDFTVPKVFSRTAKMFGEKKCLIFDDQSWTFNELEAYSNRVAHVFLRAGYKRGDCVALFMENRLEYIGLWLGCAKLGLVPALINSNLTGQPLLHSIRAASATALIYGSELNKVIREILPEVDSNVKLFVSGSNPDGFPSSVLRGVTNLDPEIVNSISEPLPESVQNLNHFTDKLLYIYTSGTTGLPKAAVIKHSRFYFYCAGMFYLGNLGTIKDPIFYDPLPLYHSAGGVVGIGLMMVFGCTVVIRKKFSVRHFWEDCRRYNCNGAQYIGEICRYLLSAPETPEEKLHKVDIMIGNGLRPPIWDQFVKRFGVKRICEFYGATEGNSSVINIDSKQGSVGFTSVLFPFVYPVRLIRVNEQTGEVARDPKTGLCLNCLPGQPGEFVGKIVSNHPSRCFDGYVDKEATEKKIVRDVLHKGDMWFRSGDLLYMDEFGWMYFVDRLGDTFRWRGENVSTNEVEAVISSLLQQQDTIVYGVEVPGVEGRAGMAAIVEPTDGIDLRSFLSAIQKQLPSYARPLFLRLVAQLDITGTFKMKKIAMQKEGFNPNFIKDQLFFYDAVMGVYRTLDHCLYNDIIEMRCRI